MFTKSCHTISALTRRHPIKLTSRLRHKTNKQTEEKQAPKVAADVVNYLENNPEYHDIQNKLPKSLLRKYKTPESMYIINKNTAKEIANTIKSHLDSDSPVVEVNPGLGFLSQELLQCYSGQLYMYETLNHFSHYLNDIQKQYPNRVKYKIADFFGMWKLAFQDKMDNGSRIKELLGELTSDDNDRIVKVVGSMPGLSFVKHLINNIVFLNTSNQLGRPDLFITMPAHRVEVSSSLGAFISAQGSSASSPPHAARHHRLDTYRVAIAFLTDSEIQTNKHKSIPALFQLLFDCKVLTTVPTVHFLPWTHPPVSKKVSVMDEYCLYLVNITQKEKLPCPPEYLPLLWYFFKPHIFSKSTRVIPMLEQWIPGCGVWLITGQDPPDTKRDLAPGESDEALPHMSIFTEFGDLSLRQKITVFKKFVSWPEFEQCQFRVTMENNLPKFVSEVEDDEKSPIGTHIDDLEHSDLENDT